MRPVFVVVLAAALAGCDGFLESPAAGVAGRERGGPTLPPPGTEPPVVPPPDLPECAQASWDVFEGLQVQCAGCHGEGANLPFMASFSAFSSLLILDPRLVAPGDPDGSRLVALLEARADGSLTQMPVGATTYAELEAAGETDIGIADVRAWIAGLEPCEYVAAHDPPIARRLRTHQMWESLRRQLGLTEADYLPAPPIASYPLYPPDRVDEPGRSDTRATATRRWAAMGGENRLLAIGASSDVTPVMMQHVIAMSQVWCRNAVAKEGNTSLFRHGGPTVGSSDEATVRANIRYLFLQILGTEATDEDVDLIYRNVFLEYETRGTAERGRPEEGARLGWVAVCTAMVRDPMWLTY